jgi:hypothetical protein
MVIVAVVVMVVLIPYIQRRSVQPKLVSHAMVMVVVAVIMVMVLVEVIVVASQLMSEVK